ncbi:MAG TPA: hypothetical protein VHA74_03615 [Candidatus Dojkabacteria bacterium]|nr:hypothetical protein [Candidatus Dojkabacteria bacterium]
MKDNGEIKNDTQLLLPFGGPGSATNFFDFHKINTVSGDIEYGRKYDSPDQQLIRFRQEYNYEGVQQKFITWDVMALPKLKEKFHLALVNPPYGVNCKTEACAIEFASESFFKILQLMETNGVLYYVIPEEWVDSFISFITKNNKFTFTKKDLPKSLNSKNPLTLLRIKI